MMLKFARNPLFTVFTVLLCFIATPQLFSAESLPIINSVEDAQKRYEEAKFFYNQLRSSGAQKTTRTQWERGARNFRIIYLSHPKSQFAPPTLFMLGEIHSDMYTLFHTPRELQSSISYYRDVLRLFPKTNVADDACFKLALIALNIQKSPAKAVEYLKKITTDYQGSNTYRRATQLIEELVANHKISIGNDMLAAIRDEKEISSLLPVRHWSFPDYTRVVITASNPVTYHKKLLSLDNNTSQLIIELDNTSIAPGYIKKVPIGNSLLKEINTKKSNKGTVQVFLDITRPYSYKVFSLPDPFRIVIDIRGTQKFTPQPITTKKKKKNENMVILEVDDLTASKKEEKQQLNIDTNGTILQSPIALLPKTHKEKRKTKEFVILKDRKKIWIQRKPTTLTKKEKQSIYKKEKKNIPLRQQLGLGVRKIVIDPGHGGKDPGATAFGLKEKNIVLKLAKKLAPILEEKIGCKVTLTRSTDIFIGLEERTAIANAEKADLFISLHVNAHPSTQIRGMETYSLNLSTNAEAMRVAAMENATSTHQMSDLENILQDILKDSFSSESAQLATKVQHSIVTLKGHGVIKNLGVKQAPFYVLINAQMPAILIETAFITNKEDSENLKNDIFLKKLAEKIGNGIKTYIDSLAAN